MTVSSEGFDQPVMTEWAWKFVFKQILLSSIPLWLNDVDYVYVYICICIYMYIYIYLFILDILKKQTMEWDMVLKKKFIILQHNSLLYLMGIYLMKNIYIYQENHTIKQKNISI